MDRSGRRLLLAIVAWPAGIIFTVAWTLLGAESTPCAPGAACMMTEQVLSLNDIVEFLTFALGPGIVATWHWWRNRRAVDDKSTVH